MSEGKNWDMNDPLEAAIYKLCDYLVAEEWMLADDGGQHWPEPDSMFPSTVRRFMSPLLDKDAMRRQRIAALKAELAVLEEDDA